jgi:hypothetical protein
MKKLFLAVIFFASVGFAHGQQVCIDQATADKCYEAAERAKSQEVTITGLRSSIEERDRIIEELKIKLAIEGQKAVDSDKENLRLIAIIESLLKSYTKPKKWGIIVF